MDAIEEKIEAIKSLFVPFDLRVEVRIGSNTVINNDGSLNKCYDCQLVRVDEFDEIPIRFIASENTEKINDKTNIVYADATSEHLQSSINELHNLCIDALQRKYDVEDLENDKDDDECVFWDGK